MFALLIFHVPAFLFSRRIFGSIVKDPLYFSCFREGTRMRIRGRGRAGGDDVFSMDDDGLATD